MKRSLCQKMFRHTLFGFQFLIAFTLAAAANAQDNASKESPPAPAQDDEDSPAETDASETDAAKKAEDNPDGAATQQPAADAGAALTAYQEKLAAWREILKDLRGLKDRFKEAEESEVEGMQRRWKELIGLGNTLIPELAVAAKNAYEATPNVDRELARLLSSLANDEMRNEHYDSAWRLVKPLIDNKSGISKDFETAGMAAFATHLFEEAAQFLKTAQATGDLDSKYIPIAAAAPEYVELWEKEKEIREAEAKADDLPRVKLETNKGDIILELFENQAKDTVGNFVSLVENGFYDGLTFHRVLPGFVAQGGDPGGDGTGGPGYNIYCECHKPEYRSHFRGTLSMAHSGPRDTGGSQFFITFIPTPHLNAKHTAFGRVIEGFDVLDKLQRRNPDEGADLPEPDKIIKAEVVRKRPDTNYTPNKVKN